MSKAWATKHNVLKPQDFAGKEETFASRNANGTGPYRLRERQPNVRTTFVRNGAYWGKIDGNVQEVVFTPNTEIDAVRWISLPEAATLLSYDADRGLLDRVRAG